MHTLLIVEDEKMIRQGIKVMVQRSGVPVEEILECSNGEMALEVLKNQKVDVMFTDIRMPKMDGIELVKAMQQLPHKPLTVAISGYDEFSYVVEMLRAKVEEYLLKPVDREQVKEILLKMEVEIQKNNEKEESSRTILAQQLKHLLQDEGVSEAEQAVIFKEYGKGFFEDEYMVCCLNTQEGGCDMAVEEDCIWLNHLDDSEIYIIKPELLEQFKTREWNGRFVGISGCRKGIESLKEAYDEAKYARKEAFWSERSFVTYSDVIDTEDEIGENEESQSLEKFIQVLGTDKYEQALKQIKNVFWNARRKKGRQNLETELCRFFEGLLRNYEAVLYAEDGKAESLKHLYCYPCIGTYEKECMEWLEEFATRLNHQFENYKSKQKIQEAIVYIKENYSKDLNMAVVSNHISMNYSLFSFAFKQYTGTNFVNFLKDIRMEKAKELLEDTDLRVSEISRKIGYENEKHFMKTFKAAYSVSPTEYRKNTQYRKR